MGIWLYTGLPGGGKTLCVVAEMCQSILKPDKEGNVPPVYADIDGLDYEGLGVNRLVPEGVTGRDDAIAHCRDWYKVEEGSYIIIDECQRVFPVRNSSAAVPQYVSEFETHRHRGYNVLLITQGPSLIDKHVRTLVERHVHLKRTFGLDRSLRIEWPAVEENPQSSFAIRRGITSTFKFPKKYFGFYKSATIHNQQRRVPWKLLVMFVFWIFLTVGGFGWYMYDLQNKYAPEISPSGALETLSGTLPAESALLCSVRLTGVVGDRLYFLDLLSNRQFQLPDFITIVRESGRDFLVNPRSSTKYLICA
mgnify:CR=1 FL=1